MWGNLVSRREALLEQFPDEVLMLADGLDDAIIGYVYGEGPVVVYSAERCVDIFMQRDGMTRDEAYDFFYYNVQGGSTAPLFMHTVNDME